MRPKNPKTIIDLWSSSSDKTFTAFATHQTITQQLFKNRIRKTRATYRFDGITNVVSATFQIAYAMDHVMPQMVSNGMALYRIGSNMVANGHII